MIKTIGEIGINHNGSLDIAKKLIDTAYVCGFDYVKFQKRTPELCVPDAMKKTKKSTPWGEMTYLEYKNKIEFGLEEYREIEKYCKGKLKWFSSVWDKESLLFMAAMTDTVKIPSAKITDLSLLADARKYFDFVIISTGMSTEKEIDEAIEAARPDVIMHTNSAYPSPVDDLNLNYITWLKNKYKNCEIGYSGHEYGLTPTFGAAMLGVGWIERHITLDHSMWGSDHESSIDPIGMFKLIKGIKTIERSRGPGGPRHCLECEKPKRDSLR